MKDSQEQHKMPPASEVDNEEDAIILNPETSLRQYYFDRFTALEREIWRPGDGDGDRGTDYHDRPGPPPPFEQRWRFYQSPTGNGPIKRDINEPPKYVLLDDRTAYEVSTSDLPRAHLAKFWPHDFAGNGKVRARRPHRGRGAVGDPDAAGDDKYYFGTSGATNEKYYWTGQPGYKPIIYRDPEAKAAVAVEPPVQSPAASQRVEHRDPCSHGHNQFTPKDLLVKNGAPSFATGPKRFRPRANKLHDADRLPPFDKAMLFGRKPKHAGEGVSKATSAATESIFEDSSDMMTQEEESLWVESEDPVARKRQRIATQWKPVDPNQLEEDAVSDFEAPPTHTLFTNATSDKSKEMRASRLKTPQHEDFFSQLLAEQELVCGSTDVDMDPASEADPNLDSGSYASQLEVELAGARSTIAEQQSRIEGLEDANSRHKERLERLEKQIALLTGNVDGMEHGGGDGITG